MLECNIPVAISATNNQCEETNAFNGPLHVETGRRAEARSPSDPHQLLERVLFKHTVRVSA